MSDKSSKKRDRSPKSARMWLVVKFINENSVEAVPDEWYLWKKDECYWPPINCSRKKIGEFIRESREPEADWKHYPASVLGNYDDLATAQRKADWAKNTSDLSSNNEEWYNKQSCYKARKKNRSPKRELSDIVSNSDTSDCMVDSDTNDYPSTTGLGVKNIKVKDVKICGKDHDQMKVNEKRGTQESLNKEPADTDLENYNNRLDANKKGSTINSLNNTSSNDRAKEFEFQKQVLKEIHAIHLKLNDIIETLSLLVKNKRFENEPYLPVNEVPDIVHLFPVNEHTLNELESWLELNANNKKLLAQELTRIGGTSTKEITRRIMYRVFTNEVGDLYSWEGAKKKKAFKKLLISSVILSAVRKNPSSESATEAEVVSFIKIWLVRCKDRINNAKIRNDLSIAKNTEARIETVQSTVENQPVELEKK